MPDPAVAAQKAGLTENQRERFYNDLVEEKAKARENLAKAKIELARRREQLSEAAGGDRLNHYNRELADLTIAGAENDAALELISRRLEQTEQQLTTAASFDPQAAQIRLAKEALDAAEYRLNELKTSLAQLRPPTVTVLGAP